CTLLSPPPTLHDALPISLRRLRRPGCAGSYPRLSFVSRAVHHGLEEPMRRILGSVLLLYTLLVCFGDAFKLHPWLPLPLVLLLRSEEHTSELQSPDHLVC